MVLTRPDRTIIRRLVTVLDPNGLHARPAALIARTASRFESAITVRCRSVSANAKSLLGLLTLGAGHGETLSIVARGADAPTALRAIEELLSPEPRTSDSFLTSG